MIDLKERLDAAVSKRKKLQDQTNTLRLVNGVGDDLPGLVLEQYNQHYLAQIFEKQWLEQKKTLVTFVGGRGGKYFIVKDRSQSSASDPDAFKAHVWIETQGPQTIVSEYGLKFQVDLKDTLNTGLFLDMRHNRKRIARLAAGQKILNCFAYTCSFGVHCRAAGASGFVNVDVSKKILGRGVTNYGLNGLTPSLNEMIRADAVEYLERAVKKDNRFDGIILDPPSFARFDGKSFSAKKDLPRLVKSAVGVLNPRGFLFVSTNLSSLSVDELEEMVRAAAKSVAQKVRNIEQFGQDEDFTGSGLKPESYMAAVLATF